jgi:hypothetical protein
VDRRGGGGGGGTLSTPSKSEHLPSYAQTEATKKNIHPTNIEDSFPSMVFSPYSKIITSFTPNPTGWNFSASRLAYNTPSENSAPNVKYVNAHTDAFVLHRRPKTALAEHNGLSVLAEEFKSSLSPKLKKFIAKHKLQDISRLF